MSLVFEIDQIAQFRQAMAAHGLMPAEIVTDGKIHRFEAPGDKHGKKSGWYIFFDGDYPSGSFGNWKMDLNEVWHQSQRNEMSRTERQEFYDRLIKAKEAQRALKESLQLDAAKKSAELWNSAAPASSNNPYCIRKGIAPYGLREFKNTRTLLVPIFDPAGKIASLQFISDSDSDNKRFKFGGRIDGCHYRFGGPIIDTVLICEGFATGASLYLATGYPIVVAFVAGNLSSVAKNIRTKLPAAKIIICADNDHFNESKNTGLVNAIDAANANGCLLAIPTFRSDEGKPTDFNDLHLLEGTAVVKTIIESAKHGQVAIDHPEERNEIEKERNWPVPEALSRSRVAVPYPVEALPQTLRNAVEEVHRFTKAPIAMVACSALANLSLATQAHHDVQRAEKLVGPIGLYFLVIAESGERKSTCDGMFSKVIRDYESTQQDESKIKIQRHEADLCAWEAIKSGIVDAIKKAASKASDTGQLEHDLRKHEEMKPSEPRVPRLIYADATPEALTYSLSNKWPSGGVICSEAGAVFGSHGMGKDSQMRTLSILNLLWDAARQTFDRRGGSYVVDGARLTISLQVQESALTEFIKKTGTLARGTGFLARFLLAHPESTQGTRFFTEPPENMPALSAFNRRIDAILSIDVPINENGGLEPTLLTLSPSAKAAWIRFHDEIETGLGKGGELQDVRDVASKIADNAVRLAAILHIFDAKTGPIGIEHFESASIIAAWHMNEALRFFSEFSISEPMADAIRLDEWLVDYCRANQTDTVSTRLISQYAPSRLRDKLRRDNAIRELISHNRVALVQSEKKQSLLINPNLLMA